MTEHRGTLNEHLWPLLVEALRPLGDKQAIGEIVDQLEADGLFTPIEPPPPDHRFLKPGVLGDDRWYALHDDDLFALSGIAAAVGTGGLSITAGISGVAALVGFLWQFRRKRVVLEPHQGYILKALIEQPGKKGTAADLAPKVGLKVERIEAELEKIRNLRRSDNKPGELLDRQPDGTWLALDL